MTAVKTLNTWGFASKVESTYGTINPCTTTDGVLLAKIPTLDFPHWLDDGKRGVTPGGAPRPEVPSSGRWGAMKVEGEGIGGGVAYSASVFPALHTLILASGYTATGSFTGGLEKWTYAPAIQPAALTSITAEANVSGQLYRLFGAYSDLEIVAGGPSVPSWNFDIIGMMDLMTDAAIPAYSTYPTVANQPMKSDNITLTIGTFTGAIVKSFHFKLGRNHKNARTNIVTGGHAGYTPGYRVPTLEVVLERCALAVSTPWTTATTFNPYKLAEDSLSVICFVTVGGTQYKKWTVGSGSSTASAQAMLVDVKDTAEGPTATWTLTFEFFPTTYTSSDDHFILYN